MATIPFRAGRFAGAQPTAPLREREYYPLNHLYGAAEVFRKYAGIPEGRPVPWAFQHLPKFWLPSDLEQVKAETDRLVMRMGASGMPLNFVASEAAAQALREAACPEVFEVGIGYLYAQELFRRRGLEDGSMPRQGTIAFPDKPGELELQFDREAYARKLRSLPQQYHPVYVSMYWRDYERGYHEPYLREGLRVVCSGCHASDPLFNERFHDICRQFKYACSNEISTSFMLCVLSGCEFFYLDSGEVTLTSVRTGGLYTGEHPSLRKLPLRRCIDASPIPPAAETLERQRELVTLVSGERFMRPPGFFREKWAEGREALSARLSTHDLVMDSGASVAGFAQWLPYGIDGDGWADAQCGIEVPYRKGFVAVELRLEFSSEVQPGTGVTVTVVLDEDPVQTLQVPINRNPLTIPVLLRPDGKRRVVRMVGPQAARLPGEKRERSLRLAGLRWIAAS